MSELKYYVVAPSVKLFGGLKVEKDTEFDSSNDSGEVHQVLKDLILTTEIKRESEYKGIKMTEESKMTTEIPEGTVLVWSESEGYIVPNYTMLTVDEAIASLEKVKDITDPIEATTKIDKKQLFWYNITNVQRSTAITSLYTLYCGRCVVMEIWKDIKDYEGLYQVSNMRQS